ncbi:MAG: ChaN family lipoprotein, partial [Ramlibacter sp.]
MRPAVAATLLMFALGGCALMPPALDLPARLAELLPADAILLGEQHDAPEHQQIERDVVAILAARGTLSAVVIEMAPRGGSTAGVPGAATEAEVQKALLWNDGAWPWPTYAAPVMAAVRAGVPVVGGNLPRSAMHSAMADVRLDG